MGSQLIRQIQNKFKEFKTCVYWITEVLNCLHPSLPYKTFHLVISILTRTNIPQNKEKSDFLHLPREKREV